LKKIVFPVVLLFGILLISTIGVSTAAATQSEPNAVVKTPKPAGEDGTVRAHIHVPQVAIDRSPVIYPLEEIPPD